jgi:hypothetical protein
VQQKLHVHVFPGEVTLRPQRPFAAASPYLYIPDLWEEYFSEECDLAEGKGSILQVCHSMNWVFTLLILLGSTSK